ncbi:serine hydrolase [uncultured Croceitalea sp.]|uniref:serine hydrolase n=1 Tax=uncultured Croceitalea sp. TaxID=1798908 RepID=UPI00330680FE
MTITSQRLLCIAILFLYITGGYSQNYEAIISQELHHQSPGGSILIAKDGNVVYHKSFGKANIELGVDMTNKSVYRIASLSKQFTAIAILKLSEENKLSLTDEITKFIPDYPMKGYNITLEHLLSHTSGIKDYLSIESFDKTTQKQDMTPEEIINFFKNEPMDFEPGTRYQYSSSGYIILGHIIEILSGMSYENYMQKFIFNPLGLSNTRYDTTTDTIKNRVSGYKKNNDNYKNANYLSMTLPYAAGSLVSTTEDFLKWNQALATEKIISSTTLESAYRPYVLKSGQKGLHGYGWEIGNVRNVKSVKHSGRINGFSTYALSVPEENVYITILTNSEDVQNIDIITTKLAAVAMGKPYKLNEVTESKSNLEVVNGIYEDEFGTQKIVRFEDQSLFLFDRGKTKNMLVPFGKGKFFVENSLTTWSIKKDNGETYLIENNTSQINRWKRVKSDIKSIIPKNVKIKNLKTYTGKYELGPNFYFEVKIENDILIGQIRSDKKELVPIGNHQFIARDIDAKLTFNLNKNKNVISLTLDQGRATTAKKID